MSLRTNPDRILENIDRQRTREEEGHAGQDRHAIGRELDITIPDIDATTPERMRRIFSIVESSYTKAAANVELGKLASHFRAVGDIPTHHARGDVSISIQYIDSPRPDDVGMAPFEIFPARLVEAKKETKTGNFIHYLARSAHKKTAFKVHNFAFYNRVHQIHYLQIPTAL